MYNVLCFFTIYNIIDQDFLYFRPSVSGIGLVL